MIGREMSLAHLKALACKNFCFFELGLIVPQIRKSDETFGHFGTIGSASRLALSERSFQERIRLIVLAELVVHSPQSLIEVGLNLGVFVESTCLLFAAF